MTLSYFFENLENPKPPFIRGDGGDGGRGFQLCLNHNLSSYQTWIPNIPGRFSWSVPWWWKWRENPLHCYLLKVYNPELHQGETFFRKCFIWRFCLCLASAKMPQKLLQKNSFWKEYWGKFGDLFWFLFLIELTI